MNTKLFYSGLTQAKSGLIVRFKQLVIEQPATCIPCILGKPAGRTTESEAVSPGIHVLHQLPGTDTRQLIGQHDLQIANRRLFEIVATRIPVYDAATSIIHADQVGCFVQQGMDGGITTHIDASANDTRFRFAPETAFDWRARRQYLQAQVVALQQTCQVFEFDVGNREHGLVRRNLFQHDPHEIFRNRIAQQLFFFFLTKNQRRIVGVIARQSEVLDIEYDVFTTQNAVAN